MLALFAHECPRVKHQFKGKALTLQPSLYYYLNGNTIRSHRKNKQGTLLPYKKTFVLFFYASANTAWSHTITFLTMSNYILPEKNVRSIFVLWY